MDGDIVITHQKTGEKKKITYSSCKSPDDVDWAGMKIDIILEATGVFLTRESLQTYFNESVKKIVVSAPVKDKEDPVLNVVYGVNHVRLFF